MAAILEFSKSSCIYSWYAPDTFYGGPKDLAFFEKKIQSAQGTPVWLPGKLGIQWPWTWPMTLALTSDWLNKFRNEFLDPKLAGRELSFVIIGEIIKSWVFSRERWPSWISRNAEGYMLVIHQLGPRDVEISRNKCIKRNYNANISQS